MRKDVKLGLGVGGILFAIVILYLVVASGGKPGDKKGADLAATGEPAGQVADAGSGDGTGGGAAEGPVATNAGNTTVEPAPGPDPVRLDVPPVKPVAEAPAPAPEVRKSRTNWALLMTQDAAPARPEHIVPVVTPVIDDPVNPDPTPAPGPVRDDDRRPEPAGTATTRPAGATATGARKHVVQRGENFWVISQTAYGSSRYFAHIQRANPNVDPARMKDGMTIILPDLTDVIAAARAKAAAAGIHTAPDVNPSSAAGGGVITHGSGGGTALSITFNPATEYRVAPGDTLYIISRKLYGKVDRAYRIYDLNKPLIGADPGRLKVGTVLRLPEAPAMTLSGR